MYNFTPGTIPNNVFVIGAGGTGGRLIPMLSQFMRSITRGTSAVGWLESPRIWLIDDDIVEQKNILRQNFIDRDVSKHKAVVLADRYTKAYGVDIVPLTMRITSAGAAELQQAVDNYLYIKNGHKNANFRNIVGSSIVVICVDSVQARRDILNNFIGQTPNGEYPKTFFVDAGNEDNFGQVTFFTPTIVTKRTAGNKEADEAELPKLCPVSADVDYIPMNIDYYRDLVDTPAQGSCADLNQTLAINAIMATTIMGVLQNYFYRKPMSYCGVSISLNGGNFTSHNTFNTFNNLGTSSANYRDYCDQIVMVKEKDETQTRLTFASACQRVDGSAMRKLLVLKMAAVKAENERLARLAEEERLAAETAARVKVIADRKRAEIRAAVTARKQQALAAVTAKVAASNAKVNAVLKGEPLPEVAALPPVVPALVATPRSARAARAVVELAVPTAWLEDVPEENAFFGEDVDDEV